MDITDYEERSPQIIEVESGWVRAFVGDDIPRTGDALGIRSEGGEEVFAAVRRHAGGRTVDAMLLGMPAWVRPGVEVFQTEESAHVTAPKQGQSSVDALAITAGKDLDTIPFKLRAPKFAELSGTRPALATGFSAIDRLSPLAHGGLNLILDTYTGPQAYDALAARVHAARTRSDEYDAVLWLSGDARAPEWATHELTFDGDAQRQLTALRALMSWAVWLRDQGQNVLFCAELPPLASRGVVDEVETAMGVSIGEVVDGLGSTLASTNSGTITTLLRLPLHASASGIEYIIETMDVGDVDAQITIDDQGRFDPYRSTSDAELDAEARSEQQKLLGVLSRAAAARDKAAMLGEFGLEPREEEALEKAEALQERLKA
ncbi:hypothetical protein FIV42_19970 [Persicimonas caeni]|uniref:Uncharacterized protein n=1 Tax=Persicimonas caeni TaxID=2292766 RepID=A0A4Y6PXA6_PERCE|nr:hypothetical protein [Persicimonas caeni]QDG52936.1 hypothetical protein FIV42_19970 [Persicimonas caeni]QED34158.1 hypothetical protein FRD00_19965 [Persicimonas caeni]